MRYLHFQTNSFKNQHSTTKDDLSIHKRVAAILKNCAEVFEQKAGDNILQKTLTVFGRHKFIRTNKIFRRPVTAGSSSKLRGINLFNLAKYFRWVEEFFNVARQINETVINYAYTVNENLYYNMEKLMEQDNFRELCDDDGSRFLLLVTDNRQVAVNTFSASVQTGFKNYLLGLRDEIKYRKQLFKKKVLHFFETSLIQFHRVKSEIFKTRTNSCNIKIVFEITNPERCFIEIKNISSVSTTFSKTETKIKLSANKNKQSVISSAFNDMANKIVFGWDRLFQTYYKKEIIILQCPGYP